MGGRLLELRLVATELLEVQVDLIFAGCAQWRGLAPGLGLGEFFTSANVADLVWSINICNMSGNTSGMSLLRDRL